MIQFFQGLIGQGTSLAYNLAEFLAIIFVLFIAVKSKWQIIPILGAILGAGIVLFGVHNTSWAQNQVQKDTNTTGAGGGGGGNSGAPPGAPQGAPAQAPVPHRLTAAAPPSAVVTIGPDGPRVALV